VLRAIAPNRAASIAARPDRPVRTRRRSNGPAAGVALLLAALSIPLSGCGESQQEKAQKAAMNTVCAARADIKSRLATLQTITPSAATLPQLKAEGAALLEDLKKIRGAQADLAPARKQQVQQATETFQSEVTTILSGVSSLTAGSLSSAGAQLRSALSRLESGYVKAFEPIECP
jgi:hypothetical protein